MNARTPQPSLAAPALYVQVAEQLRARIFSHDLAPGAWIDEQALTNEYGISRTPLREALKVLAAEGLVQLKPRRGCYVAEVSDQDVDEVFPVMAALEAKAAEEATRRATSADLSRLKAIQAELESFARIGDVDRYFDANQRFHVALQEISANGYLRRLIEDARKLIKLVRRDSLLLSGRITQSVAEHRGILDAVLAGDAALAAQRMHEHLLSGRQAVARLHSESPVTQTG